MQEFGDHPNIIKLLNVIRAQNDKDIYLIFEYMGECFVGINLQSWSTMAHKQIISSITTHQNEQDCSSSWQFNLAVEKALTCVTLWFWGFCFPWLPVLSYCWVHRLASPSLQSNPWMCTSITAQTSTVSLWHFSFRKLFGWHFCVWLQRSMYLPTQSQNQV